MFNSFIYKIFFIVYKLLLLTTTTTDSYEKRILLYKGGTVALYKNLWT